MANQKVLCLEQRIITSNCDLNGQWKPSAILETMQEAGGEHAELLGIGRDALIRQDIVWIVTRNEIVMDRYPRIGEMVTIETFPMPVRRWFFPRYFVFRDEQGRRIGYAGSLWALLNIKDRRMVSPDGVRDHLPDNSDLPAPMGLPALVNEVAGTLETREFVPAYADFDVNGHVNNTRYIDWCCNALGIDTMKSQQLKRIIVNYDQEIRAGQTVRTELRRLGDDFSFCGFRDGNRSFDVGGTLAERQ